MHMNVYAQTRNIKTRSTKKKGNTGSIVLILEMNIIIIIILIDMIYTIGSMCFIVDKIVPGLKHPP